LSRRETAASKLDSWHDQNFQPDSPACNDDQFSQEHSCACQAVPVEKLLIQPKELAS